MSKQSAESFLHALDTNESVRNDVHAAINHVVEVGKKHGHHFTSAELNEAMKEKWGAPKHRQDVDDPYTCFCFSETPGQSR